MKYTGTILGMYSQSGSVYLIPIDDFKCYIFRASVVAEFKSKGLFIIFNWNRNVYELQLSELKPSYFTGDMLINGKKGGSVYLWMFKRENDLLFKGDFDETEVGPLDCFLELKLFQPNT